MKNILVVVKNLTSGGAEKQSVLLAKALSGTCNVHYVILNHKYQHAKYLTLLAESPEIKVVAFNGSVYSRFLQFSDYMKKAQIEYVFSYLTAANFFAVFASRLSGVKNVYTGIRNAYLPPVKASIDRLLCNRFATAAILNCYSGEAYFLEKGFAKEKMIVIPNCFENIAAYKAKDISDGILKVISVGRFVEQKDYFTALAIIDVLRAKNEHILYQIVGYGELEEVIRTKITALGLEKNVEVHINPDNIAELLDGADIYLSTSIFEGTSNSIMEAMNANLPIVATNVGDNYKLVLHGENGFIADVKDVQQMSSYVGVLLADEALRKSMGYKSKEHLLGDYSVDQFRNRYQNLIKD